MTIPKENRAANINIDHLISFVKSITSVKSNGPKKAVALPEKAKKP